MSGKELLDAIGYVDAELIEEADRPYRKKNRYRMLVGTAAAACLCLVIGLFGWRLGGRSAEETEEAVVTAALDLDEGAETLDERMEGAPRNEGSAAEELDRGAEEASLSTYHAEATSGDTDAGKEETADTAAAIESRKAGEMTGVELKETLERELSALNEGNEAYYEEMSLSMQEDGMVLFVIISAEQAAAYEGNELEADTFDGILTESLGYLKQRLKELSYDGEATGVVFVTSAEGMEEYRRFTSESVFLK